MALKTRIIVIIQRPPYLSVRIPTGSRNIEPTKTGIPSNQPICIGLHLNTPCSTRKVTSTPFIIQAEKQIINASVLNKSMRQDNFTDGLLITFLIA